MLVSIDIIGGVEPFDYIERFHNPRVQRRIDVWDLALMAFTQLSAETG